MQALGDGWLEESLDHLRRKEKHALASDFEARAVLRIVLVGQLLQSRVLHDLRELGQRLLHQQPQHERKNENFLELEKGKRDAKLDQFYKPNFRRV
jgi:hypothetical protein